MLTTTGRTQVFFVFITVIVRLIILVIILISSLLRVGWTQATLTLALTKAENEALPCIAPLQNLQHSCPGPLIQPTKSCRSSYIQLFLLQFPALDGFGQCCSSFRTFASGFILLVVVFIFFPLCGFLQNADACTHFSSSWQLVPVIQSKHTRPRHSAPW